MSFFTSSVVKSSLLVVIFIIGTSNTWSDNKYKKYNPLSVKSISFIESNKSRSLTMADGNIVNIPVFEKVISEFPGAFSIDNLLDLSEDISFEKLKEEIALKDEIVSLSEKLGLKDIAPENLPLYREINNWIGTRYRRGGMSHTGVDCSGFTNIIYNAVFNKQLPRVSTDIANNIDESLTKEELQPGDLLFFCTRGRKRINHVGIYLGNNKFAHASIYRGVVVSTLSDNYYSRTWRKAGRVDVVSNQ